MDSGRSPARRYRPKHGRHRQATNAMSWTPDVPIPPPAPERSPLVDTDSVGLRKFDLGMVPASITPPRSWRKAAWFAGLSSAVVLAVLVIAATALVGPSRAGDDMEALPGYPNGLLLPTGTPDTGQDRPTGAGRFTRSSAPKSAASETGSGSPAARAPGAPGAPAQPRGSSEEVADSSAPGGAPVDQPGTGTRPVTPTSTSRVVPVTTAPAKGAPVVEPQKLADQTMTFFSTAVSDPRKAFDTLAGPDLKTAGFAAFQQRFGNLDGVEFMRIRVDQNKAITTSVVEVRTEDGTVSVQERELRFTVAEVPLVNAERLVSAG